MENKKRERRRNRLPEGWLQEFIRAYDIKSTDDLKGALADLVSRALIKFSIFSRCFGVLLTGYLFLNVYSELPQSSSPGQNTAVGIRFDPGLHKRFHPHIL